MTKYIIAGGNDRGVPDYGVQLGKEIHKTCPKPRLLTCFFAGPEDHWPMMAEKWKPWFDTYLGPLAAYDYARVATFQQQIHESDVIYLQGGPNEVLFETMRQFDDLPALFDGKIVVGSSAGANLLSKNFWGSSKQVARKGRAVVDANIMVHYGATDHAIHRTGADWESEEKEFRKFIGSASEKVWHIPEGKFIVFETEDLDGN